MTPKSRGHGEGSINVRRNRKGKVLGYRAELMVGFGPDGKALRWRQMYKTRQEAVEGLAQAILDRGRGTLVVSNRQTVGEYLTTWLRDVVQPTVYARTYVSYERLVRLHITPALGHLRLDRLTPQHVQTLYSEKRQTLSAVTVTHLHACLHRAMGNAVRWGLIPINPCDRVDAPHVGRRAVSPLTPEQARALLAAARSDPLEAYWLLALTTAMRPSELLGLRWSDVDLSAGLVRLQRSVGRIPGQGWDEKDTKTHQGRAIVLTGLAVEALKRHRAAQAAARLKAGSGWEDRGLVFCNSLGRPIEQSNLYRRSWLPLLERAGLPRLRPYDLRHSAASLLLTLGVSPKVVAEILGHSTTRLTLDTYSHTLPSLQAEAIQKLEGLLTAP